MKDLIRRMIPGKVWACVRLHGILSSHRKVARYWNPLIDRYEEGAIPHILLSPKKALDKKPVWQYWGQGFDDKLPELVRLCLASVDKHVDEGEYEVIRLDDGNISEYVDLPQCVLSKASAGVLPKAQFSDLLRIALLSAYGGIWIDATILLSGPVPGSITGSEFFAYQRSRDEKDIQYWESTYACYFGWHPEFKVRMLNSFMVSRPHNQLVDALLSLLVHYWDTRSDIIDYFFFQILFNEFVARHPDWNCPVVSDTLPHLLMTRITGGYDAYSYDDIMRMTAIHKLSYKTVAVESLPGQFLP